MGNGKRLTLDDLTPADRVALMSAATQVVGVMHENYAVVPMDLAIELLERQPPSGGRDMFLAGMRAARTFHEAFAAAVAEHSPKCRASVDGALCGAALICQPSSLDPKHLVWICDEHHTMHGWTAEEIARNVGAASAGLSR